MLKKIKTNEKSLQTHIFVKDFFYSPTEACGDKTWLVTNQIKPIEDDHMERIEHKIGVNNKLHIIIITGSMQ